MQDHTPSKEPVKASIQKRGSFAGTGCLVQGAGIALGIAIFALIPFVGWALGPLVALGLLVAGSRMAVHFECSVCRNPVASKRVRLCPTCGAVFI